MKNKLWLIPILSGLLGIPAAQAQWRTDSSPPRDDRPGIGVARVSLSDGEVEVLRDASGDRLQALGGMPILGNNTITTGHASRAELQFGPANFIRMQSDTQLKVNELGNRYFRVEVTRGSIVYSQLRGGESDVDINARQATVRPLKNGVYRIWVREGGQTDITVRKGEAEIASDKGTEILKKGRRMSIRGEAPDAELRIAKADSKDSFDEWNQRRDKLLEPRAAYRGWGWSPYLYGGGWYPGFGWGLGYSYRPYFGPSIGVFGSFGRGGGRGGGGGHGHGGRR